MAPVQVQEGLHIVLHLLVARLAQKIPVKLPGLAPLLQLGEFLAHEEQLLAGMAQHEGIGRLQVRELVVRIARHLIVHGAFQVHHLVVGEHQDIFLAVSVGHGKGHQMMGPFAEIGVELHILQEVVHPAHVPLEREAQAVVLGLVRHLRPGCGFLGNHHGARIAAQEHGVQVLEEFHRLQVLVAAVFIGHPLAGLLAVIQVEHGSHRVHPQAVHMVLLHPVEGVGNQEVLDLVHLIIEDLGAPVRMLALSRIGILIQGLAVEIRQAVGVPGEMGGNPVQDHADFFLMQVIHQVHEVLGAAVAGGGSVIARHLIAPGAVEGMLRDSHQLHMGIAHLGDVIRQAFGQLPVIVEAVLVRTVGMLFPGTRMHLVDGHRLLGHRLFPALLQPGAVRPLKAVDIRHAGSRAWPHLRREGEGICLVELPVVLRLDQVFIEGSQPDARDKALPDAQRLQPVHGPAVFCPAVEIPYHMNLKRVGRPYREIYALLPVYRHRVRAQLPENIIVRSLAEQILVQIPHKAVRTPYPSLRAPRVFLCSCAPFSLFFHNLTPVLR